jgi:hypothetical protein
MDIRGSGNRQAADWPGRYRFEEDPDVGDGRCRLVDVSRVGAGVEVFGDTPINPIGHRVTVDVREPGDATIGVRLTGTVRNITLGHSGGVRIGVQFVEVSELGRAILDALEQVQIAG